MKMNKNSPEKKTAVDNEADLEVESIHTCGRDRLGYVQTRPLKFVKASKFKSDKAKLFF